MNENSEGGAYSDGRGSADLQFFNRFPDLFNGRETNDGVFGRQEGLVNYMKLVVFPCDGLCWHDYDPFPKAAYMLPNLLTSRQVIGIFGNDMMSVVRVSKQVGVA